MAYEFQNKTWVHGWEGMSEEEQREFDEICKEEEEAEIAERARYPERFSDDLKDSPMEITIKPEILDTSSLEESNNDKDDFRPSSFTEYIGQTDAKQRIISYIDGCGKFNETFPHTFLSAPAGCGKTVFANILANMLNKTFVKCGAVELKSEQQLVDKIVECNGGILFIDEFHKISNKIGTFMLPILEERLVAGKKIKPFTCIVATTHKGNLSEDLSALVQRFLPIELEHYIEEDLIKILKQFHFKTYESIDINENIFNEIAENSKYTPRIGIRLLREYAYTENLEIVKTNNKIIKGGLTKTDVKVLKYLELHNGVGKNSLAKYLNVQPKTYEFEIEPFLILKDLIIVSSRRKITEKGKEFLKCLK